MTGNEVIAKLKAAGWLLSRIPATMSSQKAALQCLFPFMVHAISELAWLQRFSAKQASS